MPIVTADLINYLSVSMPEDDSNPSGGAIDITGKAKDLVLATTSTLEILSSSAGDTTQSVTVKGRNAAGAIISDTKTLNGTTAVAISGTFERVNKVTISSATAGTVTLRISGGGATVVTLEPGIIKIQRLMSESASEGTQTKRFEKTFWKNNHSTLTLNSAKVKIVSGGDPSANCRIGLTASKNDSTSVLNRKQEPAGISWNDDNLDAIVPGNTLEAGSVIGVWVEYTLDVNETAVKSTLTHQLSGSTV